MIPPPAIIDTNVVVAGLLTSNERAPTARILDGMVAGTFRFLLTVALLAEYRTVLLRPKIAQVHGLDEEEVDSLLEEITLNAALHEGNPSDASTSSVPDPNDQHLWELLDAAPDAVLVTGDRPLLDQDDGAERSILSPASFVKLLDASLFAE